MDNHDFGTMLVNDIIKRINVKNKKDFNYNNFVKLIFEYAKFVHGITDEDNIELSFKDLGDDNIGGDFSMEDKTITINSNNFTFKKLGIVINSILHETEHATQEKYVSKHLDCCDTPTLPVKLIHSSLQQMKMHFTTPHLKAYGFDEVADALYYTAKSEYNARDYASIGTERLLNFLAGHAQTRFAKKLVAQCMQANKKLKKTDDKCYAIYLNSLKKFRHIKTLTYLCLSAVYRDMDYVANNKNSQDPTVRKLVNLLRKSFVVTISSIAEVYCDDKIKQEITEKCLEYKDIPEIAKCIPYIHQSVYCKTTKQDLNTIFDLVANSKISYDEMMKGLCYFSKAGINCAFVNYLNKNNIFENYADEHFDAIRKIDNYAKKEKCFDLREALMGNKTEIATPDLEYDNFEL